jgi:transcriptional regulator with XRE-family HTH domain
MPFGDRLRHEREKRSWSTRQLARLAQVPHETISRVENHHQHMPSMPVAMRLARALGVSLDYLAGMYSDEPLDIRRQVSRHAKLEDAQGQEGIFKG